MPVGASHDFFSPFQKQYNFYLWFGDVCSHHVRLMPFLSFCYWKVKNYFHHGLWSGSVRFVIQVIKTWWPMCLLNDPYHLISSSSLAYLVGHLVINLDSLSILMMCLYPIYTPHNISHLVPNLKASTLNWMLDHDGNLEHWWTLTIYCKPINISDSFIWLFLQMHPWLPNYMSPII